MSQRQTLQRPRSNTTPDSMLRSAAPVATPALIQHRLPAVRPQARLTIGPVDDPYEREAERVAEQVLRMPAPVQTIQRAPLAIRRCGKCAAAVKIEDMCPSCAAKAQGDIQRAAAHEIPEVTPVIEAEIGALRGGGQPLDGELRAFMEPRFGHDFSGVRVHTGSQAANAAASVGALAFTLGSDVVFGAGQYEPGSQEGKRLIAHELTHVVQQGGISSSTVQLQHNKRISRQLNSQFEPDDIQTVKIWLNAFIPKNISGLTSVVPYSGGKTMINGPVPLVSDCFETDQRSFDTSVNASSRIHAEVEIDVSTPSILWQWNKCDKTHEVDCESGEQDGYECERRGTVVGGYDSLQMIGVDQLAVHLSVSSSNPCFSGSPDIDAEGWVYIDLRARRVTFNGLIDQFPAFEMYATANGGAGRTIFRTNPKPGKSPADLFGSANRPVIKSTSI